MKVRDCFQNVTPDVDLVSVDTSIEDIIEIISANTASRSVFVVDEDEKLVGIISIREVIEILGAKYLKNRSFRLAHGILAKTAADIMRDAEFVDIDDDLEEALKISVLHDFDDIPVVENGKVVGDVDCFELVKGIREEHKKIQRRMEKKDKES
jgi:CBS domain-containing protein